MNYSWIKLKLLTTSFHRIHSLSMSSSNCAWSYQLCISSLFELSRLRLSASIQGSSSLQRDQLRTRLLHWTRTCVSSPDFLRTRESTQSKTPLPSSECWVYREWEEESSKWLHIQVRSSQLSWDFSTLNHVRKRRTLSKKEAAHSLANSGLRSEMEVDSIYFSLLRISHTTGENDCWALQTRLWRLPKLFQCAWRVHVRGFAWRT